ncbi:hypothetical protein BpHYR1_015656 [Brachionus plicatilis]|uniref:Uncharacterized protein n=1 Tax=Brachionus plicatilis TaxID=10195 RepID=A0A3M7RIH2_BRAPC|nr:hypothetical protein BpHYR1_015656 [Brachionus plicatilis]
MRPTFNVFIKKIKSSYSIDKNLQILKDLMSEFSQILDLILRQLLVFIIEWIKRKVNNGVIKNSSIDICFWIEQKLPKIYEILRINLFLYNKCKHLYSTYSYCEGSSLTNLLAALENISNLLS